MTYDLIVIGTGPGGYVCAIRAAQLGLKVAVVEKRATFGGTCLNVGCIPSKAMLHASERYEEAGHSLGAMGIELPPPKLDLAKMLAFKDQGVKGNVDGVAFLLKKNKIDTVHGTASIAAPGKVEVGLAAGGAQTLEAKSIVIATGSDVARLPGIDIDEETIVSSTGALSLPQVPKRMLVIGAGVIGLELGSVWRRLGSEVQVVEFLDRVLPGVDGEVGRTVQRLLGKQGMSFKLSSKVTAVNRNGAGHRVTVEPASGPGEAAQLDADVVLVAIGRVPYTNGLGLESVGVNVDNRRRVIVDAHYQTSVPGIYAIGDVIAGPMLAHKAEDEGMAVAEILGRQGRPRELRRDPQRDLHLPRGGQRRQVGGGAEGGGRRLQRRQVPPHGQRPRQGQQDHRRLHQGSGRCHDRPHPRRAHDRPRGERDDRRGRRHHGVRRLGRGPGPHLPRPPFPDRGGEGSRARRR